MTITSEYADAPNAIFAAARAWLIAMIGQTDTEIEPALREALAEVETICPACDIPMVNIPGDHHYADTFAIRCYYSSCGTAVTIPITLV